jgi:hypothetical protein
MGVVSSESKSAGYEVRNHPHPILSTHSECSLSEIFLEKTEWSPDWVIMKIVSLRNVYYVVHNTYEWFWHLYKSTTRATI